MSIVRAKLIQSLRKESKTNNVDKGDFNGECNRGACTKRNAIWYNSPMYKYYCTSCARMINESSNQSGQGDICKIKIEENEIT